jgi:PAS domain-containing protein
VPITRQGQAATSSPLPIITIVAVSGWLVLFMVRGHPDPEVMTRILSCLVLLFLVLSVREAFVFRDNTRWLDYEVEREARARFEILVQHSSDVIMLVDSEYKIRFASPSVAAALDVTADDDRRAAHPVPCARARPRQGSGLPGRRVQSRARSAHP